MYLVDCMTLNPGEIVGRHYRIIRLLGSGGFGTTYLAEDTDQQNTSLSADSDTCPIVLKQIRLSSQTDISDIQTNPQYFEQLEREANTLRNLQHPCIPEFLNSFYDNEGQYYYIVQEYIQGFDLTHEILPGTRFSEVQAKTILREILEILAFVHQNNIIHRDVKPANIIRRKSDNKLVLIDFGAVKEIATEYTNTSGELHTRIICSEGYTPGEQSQGNPKANSDIYALGIMIMQLTTGFSIEAICDGYKFPMMDDKCNYLWEEHVPHISSEFKQIISNMIRYYFDNRYQTVEDVIQDLDHLETKIVDPFDTADNPNNDDQGVYHSIDKSNSNNVNPDKSLLSPVITPANSPIGVEDQSYGDRKPNNNGHNSNQEFSPSSPIVEEIEVLHHGEDNLPVSEGSQASLSPRRYSKKIKLAIIALITCIAAILLSTFAIPFIPNPFPSNNACTIELADHLSCGEEILDPFSKGANKIRATKLYQQKKYSQAVRYFKKHWREDNRDPETLIYLNNALLDANKVPVETISVAVPFSSDEAREINSSDIAQSFLRGVAQAQTEINLSLSRSNSAVAQELAEFEFLPFRAINDTYKKGLKVIIADDANNGEQAATVANQLADSKSIGIIGHYTSKMTLDTVDIYQQQDLAQISYGTTTKELSTGENNNFFRVVYTTKEEAEALVSYIEQYDLPEKKVAIFYNPSSDYSLDLKKSIEKKIQDLDNSLISVIKTFDLADEQNFSTSLAMKKLDELGINICLLLPDGQISNSLARAIDVIQADNGQRLILGANPLINPKVNNIQTDQPLNLVVSTFWHHTIKPESKFNQQTRELWKKNVHSGTAVAYDATLAMIEAIKGQQKPNREGTIEQLSASDFAVEKAATGEIVFNTPKNGDRLDFYPMLVRLHECKDGKNKFVSLSLDDNEASNLVCQ